MTKKALLVLTLSVILILMGLGMAAQKIIPAQIDTSVPFTSPVYFNGGVYLDNTSPISAGPTINITSSGITVNTQAFHAKMISGGAAGLHAVSGMTAGSSLIDVAYLYGLGNASPFTASDLTSQFTVASGNINNTGGSNTAGGYLWVQWITSVL